VREIVVDIGRPVRYLEAGAGWPVVLLHGFPLTADMWRPQLDAPPQGWRLLAPDLRGFGSAAADAATTLDAMAADVVAWLDALRIERAVIGGLSMGGYVTFALYRLAPERFTALVLANTRAAADSPDARGSRDTLAALVREKGAAALAEAMLPRLLGDAARRSRPALASTVHALVAANSAEGLAGALEAMKNRPDSTTMLPGIGRPALVVAGAEDAIVPREESEEMNRLLPRSHLAVIPRAGHLSNLENPDDFSEVLGNFLRSNL
jgi:3-oxoadipate enol-lactonase